MWDAYWILHNSRQIGFSQGPIQLTEIAAYISIYGIPLGQKGFFLRVIRELDSEFMLYLSEIHEIQKMNAKAQAGKSGKIIKQPK